MTLAIGKPVPAELADARVVTTDGAERALGESWAARDAVLVFVRHFACAGCSAHVSELRPRLEELAALDVATVVVGNGSVDQLAAFVEREKLAGHPVELVTDPSRTAYLAAGLERSLIGTIGPRALANVAGLVVRGHRQWFPEGDLTQQGGSLYVTRGGELAFYHRSARLGDHARIVEVVDVALARAAERAPVAGA